MLANSSDSDQTLHSVVSDFCCTVCLIVCPIKKKLGLYGLRMHTYLTSEARYNMCGIIELWVTVKVVTLIWAWFGYFICPVLSIW